MSGGQQQQPWEHKDMAIYMKVDGVKGRVTAEQYKDYIEVESCQVGATCPTQARAGNMGDRTGGTISYSDVTVSRRQDDSTTDLFQKMFEKKQIPKVEFKFVKTSADKFLEYMKVTISDALITSYSISGHGGDNHDRPHEMISFSFSKIEYLVKPENEKDAQNFSRGLLKRPDAEVLLDMVSQVTGVAERFRGAPAGTRRTTRACGRPTGWGRWWGGIECGFRLAGRPSRRPR